MNTIASKLLHVASKVGIHTNVGKRLRRIAESLRVGRGDPAGIMVTSPIGPATPKDPSTTIRDQSDTLLSVMKILSSDKQLAEGVNHLNKRAVGLQKDFEELGKLLVSRLTKKDDKDGAEELLKQSKLKALTDVLTLMGKELQPYVDTAKLLKDLHDQTQREKKKSPKEHKKRHKKVDVEPKGSEKK